VHIVVRAVERTVTGLLLQCPRRTRNGGRQTLYACSKVSGCPEQQSRQRQPPRSGPRIGRPVPARGKAGSDGASRRAS
jgi:hypothetical protein